MRRSRDGEMDDDAPAETGPRTAAAPPAPAWRRLIRPGRLPVLALVTYAATQLVLLFWWVAYYPGLFSPDSLNYMWQSTTGNWNTHHPVAYTSLVWLSLQTTGGVGALTLLQTVLLAAGLAYAVTGLRRLGGPGWLWALAAVVLVALPPIGSFVLSVWKDVAFALCHVFLFGTVARLVALRKERGGPAKPALPRTLLYALLVELVLLCLFRQNGVIVAAVIIAVCALVMRGVAWRVVIAGGSAIVIALLTNWLLPPALGVRNAGSMVALESVFSDIAVGYAKDPAGFPARDTAVMAQVAPLDHWRSSADCYSVDPTVWSPNFDRTAAQEHLSDLVGVWRRLAQRSPGTVIEARICRSAIGWQPTSTGNVARSPNPWSVRAYVQRDPAFQASPAAHAAYSRPLSQRAAKIAIELNTRTVTPEWLWWRGAPWAYAAYLIVGLVAWRRREPALVALASLSAGNQLSVMVVNAAQSARYMVVPFMLGILLLPLLATARREADRTAPEPDDVAPDTATSGTAAAEDTATDTTRAEEPGPDEPAPAGSAAKAGSGQVG
ncbi:DUF6020 family protein [Micromonospora sp. NPDC049523]|uniref:DUF6020 family protein n=1 Tax=Micromonospora sp. NPDC049523 TaxID=3155921 RepID=UPI00344050AA